MNKRIAPMGSARVTAIKQVASPTPRLTEWGIKLAYRAQQLSGNGAQIVTFTLITQPDGRRQLIVGAKTEELGE